MEVRAATADDHDAYARLKPELGAEDPVLGRDDFVASVCPRMIVATREAAVVGFAVFDVLADVGYVRNVVSDPAHRRQGIGVALMTAMQERFRAAALASWCLNVKPDNLAAVALYRRFGLAPAHRTTMVRLPTSAPRVELPPELTLSAIPPEDDATVETVTHLLRGQLTAARAKPDRRLLQLRRRDELVGAGVFVPGLAGAFPFRVLEPTLGPPMLELLRPLAPSGSPYVQVGIEDDDALRDALLALGAQVHREILHMRGPLEAHRDPLESVPPPVS